MHGFISAFYFVALIYISVLVPVPYCLHDSGFVVEAEVSLMPCFHLFHGKCLTVVLRNEIEKFRFCEFKLTSPVGNLSIQSDATDVHTYLCMF